MEKVITFVREQVLPLFFKLIQAVIDWVMLIFQVVTDRLGELFFRIVQKFGVFGERVDSLKELIP